MEETTECWCTSVWAKHQRKSRFYHLQQKGTQQSEVLIVLSTWHISRMMQSCDENPYLSWHKEAILNRLPSQSSCEGIGWNYHNQIFVSYDSELLGNDMKIKHVHYFTIRYKVRTAISSLNEKQMRGFLCRQASSSCGLSTWKGTYFRLCPDKAILHMAYLGYFGQSLMICIWKCQAMSLKGWN